MNLAHTFLLTFLSASIACAQDTPAPAPAAEPAQTEMQKWIATTDAQWQVAFNRDVTDVHAADIKNLALQYAADLDAAVTKASGAGDLDGAVALRNEKKRYAETNVFPEQDDAADVATVKQLRAAIRTQLAKVEKDAAARTKALHAKYDALLADAQLRLTKAQRLEDALLVKTKRDEVAAAWIAPLVPDAPERTPLTKKIQETPPDARQVDEQDARAVEGALAFLNPALKKAASVSSSLTQPQVKSAVVRDIDQVILHATDKLNPRPGRRGSHEDAKLTLEIALAECRSSKADVARLRKLLEKATEQLKPPAAGIRK